MKLEKYLNYIDNAIAKLLYEKHNTDFVRTDSVDAIAARLKKLWAEERLPCVFLIEGLPGIGKSAAANYVGEVLKGSSPDRVIKYFFSKNRNPLENVNNFYAYVCGRIELLLAKDEGNDAVTAALGKEWKTEWKWNDLQDSIVRLADSIGKDDQKRVLFVIDGVEELDEHEELLRKLPAAQGMVYALFSQPGVCEGKISPDFKENGKIKNQAAIEFLGKKAAAELFWEVYGDKSEASGQDADPKISERLDAHLSVEENRYPLLLRVLAEDAKDGFNPSRAAWAKGLREYVDERYNDISEAAKKLLAQVSLARGPLAIYDLLEILNISPFNL